MALIWSSENSFPTPHTRAVEQRQRLVGPVEVDQEQREMPPVVGVQEGIAVLPRVGDRLQESDALDQPPARLEAMRQRMMRPRVLALHLDRAARMRLGLVEPIALLQPEGIHAPDEMSVRGWRRTDARRSAAAPRRRRG